ncbi:hypothetical protein ACA910_007053 [Epithemia clementina (nom. ined.)]
MTTAATRRDPKQGEGGGRRFRSLPYYLLCTAALQLFGLTTFGVFLPCYRPNDSTTNSYWWSWTILLSPFQQPEQPSERQTTLLSPWQPASHEEQQQQEEEEKPMPAAMMDDLSQEIKKLISVYQDIVADSVEFQTASWFRYLGTYRVPQGDDDAGSGDHAPPPYVPARQQRLRHPADKPTIVAGNSQTTTTTTTTASDETIIWDDEKDISSYFERLISTCRSKNNKKIQECFVFFQELIHQPRCTVRMDSRTTCRRRTSSSAQYNNKTSSSMGTPLLVDAQSLQEENEPSHNPISSILGPDQHFQSNTMNIVILGGGPVGLYLANALKQIPAELQRLRESKRNSRQEDEDDSSGFPELRIVVLENRIMAEGHKKPYTRIWGTDIPIDQDDDFANIDPRIVEFLETMTLPEETATVPLNFWETLLLLSNRDLGVKFVYGNVHDYTPYLRQVPNLIMFDATGHRLQPLERGQQQHKDQNNNDHQRHDLAETNNTKYYLWASNSIQFLRGVLRRWQFPVQWLALSFQRHRLGRKDEADNNSNNNKNEKQLEIALHQSEQGPLLYPVLPDHRPYFVYRFDLSNLEYNKWALEKLESIVNHAFQTFRREHHVDPPARGEAVVDYNDIGNFKPHVWQQILDSPTFLGMEISGYSIKPTQQQGLFLDQLMRRHRQPGESTIPWSRISPEEYKGEPVLKTNRVDELLDIATTMSQTFDTPGGVLANLYRSEPFLYPDPAVPGGFPLGGEEDRHVPLLRVGNSLFSGDTDVGSGLGPQLYQIRMLQCRIFNLYLNNINDHRDCHDV